MKPHKPLADISNEFARVFGEMKKKQKPMTAEAYRAHIFETYVLPSVRRWGFEERFARAINLSGAQEKAFHRCKAFLKANGAIIALVGSRGVGKTTIAAQFAQEKAWKNYEGSMQDGRQPRPFVTVSYRKMQKLISDFKTLYSDAGSYDNATLTERLDRYCANEYCVIDEVYECDDLRAKDKILTDICDRRYAQCLDTILISNQDEEEFSETIGNSIMSRLGEHGCIIPCRWKSFRE